MKKRVQLIVSGLFLTGVILYACTAGKQGLKPEAPLFSGLDTYEIPITTSSKLARTFFNQGSIAYRRL